MNPLVQEVRKRSKQQLHRKALGLNDDTDYRTLALQLADLVETLEGEKERALNATWDKRGEAMIRLSDENAQLRAEIEERKKCTARDSAYAFNLLRERDEAQEKLIGLRECLAVVSELRRSMGQCEVAYRGTNAPDDPSEPPCDRNGETDMCEPCRLNWERRKQLVKARRRLRTQVQKLIADKVVRSWS